MDAVSSSSKQDGTMLLQQVVSQYGAPAYIRRARRVEEALEQLLAKCRRQRDEWLGMVRLRLGEVGCLATTWEALRPFLADDAQVELLRVLHEDLQPRLRLPVAPTISARVLRRALRELCASLHVFNRRWQEFLLVVDCRHVNEERDGYNRYYLLEKECAGRLHRHGRDTFRKLQPLTRDDLARLLPPLPVPRLA